MALVLPTLDNPDGYFRELYKYLAILGAGSSLSDPGADRILFWDDSAGQVTWLTAGTGLTLSGTTLSLTSVPTVSTYAPTVTGTVNVDSASAINTDWSYFRLDDAALIWGAVRINATTAGSSIAVRFSLPIASTISGTTGPWGSATPEEAARGIAIQPDIGNAAGLFTGVSTLDTDTDYSFICGYRIV